MSSEGGLFVAVHFPLVRALQGPRGCTLFGSNKLDDARPLSE